MMNKLAMIAITLSLAVASLPASAQNPTTVDRPQGMGGPSAPQLPAAQPSPMATAVPSQAPAIPTTQDACISAAQALFQTAEGRRLAEAKRDRLEELLVRMEAHCAARQFQEASAIASDIRVMIEAN